MGRIQGMQIVESQGIKGRVSIRHLASVHGRSIPIAEALTLAVRRRLEAMGIRPESLTENLVVNTGRAQLARMIRRDPATNQRIWIDRVQLGDCKVGGIVVKTDYPPDLSDTALVHEIRTLADLPGATFDLDSDSSPDEVIKVDASVGTPAVLTAGVTSLLTDTTGVDFVASGVTDRDTVRVWLGGEDFILGVDAVNSASELEVANPSQLAGPVGYTVQTPGTQSLFQKLISGNNFPEADYGPVTVVHEAGLLFTNDVLFNRVVFQAQDNDLGLVLQPQDIDGTQIDVQLDWLITF